LFNMLKFCRVSVPKSTTLRQESHFEKLRLEVSARSALAWCFFAILKAFLKSQKSVRSAMWMFLSDTGRRIDLFHRNT